MTGDSTKGLSMLTNRLKVMLQRVYNGHRRPKKILLSRALLDALVMEKCQVLEYQRPPNERATFAGIPIGIVYAGVTEPIIELEPLDDGPKELQVKDLL